MRRPLLAVTAAFAAALVVMAWPDVAEACPTCFSAAEENRTEYLLTFALMTILPLASIGGIVWFIVRRARAAELAERGETA